MQYAKPVTLNVEECDRLSFLSYLFGNDFLYAEASVYALAKKMMPEYEGGFWHFIRLPDGGGYMMPDGDRFHLVNGENWFDRTVSADAAGIILTFLVINRQLWLYHDSGDAGLKHLYDSQIAALERKASDDEACGEIETAHPGYLGSQDTFYVGNLKGVGRIYQQTFVDTYSKVAHCKLYVTKTPISAADLLNDRVKPFVKLSSN